jgi:hypothetical protein
MARMAKVLTLLTLTPAVPAVAAKASRFNDIHTSKFKKGTYSSALFCDMYFM